MDALLTIQITFLDCRSNKGGVILDEVELHILSKCGLGTLLLRAAEMIGKVSRNLDFKHVIRFGEKYLTGYVLSLEAIGLAEHPGATVDIFGEDDPAFREIFEGVAVKDVV